MKTIRNHTHFIWEELVDQEKETFTKVLLSIPSSPFPEAFIRTMSGVHMLDLRDEIHVQLLLNISLIVHEFPYISQKYHGKLVLVMFPYLQHKINLI